MGIPPAHGLWTSSATSTLSGSPICQPTLQILDSPSLHKHVSEFLNVNLLLYVHILLVLFLWRTLTNAGHLMKLPFHQMEAIAQDLVS